MSEFKDKVVIITGASSGIGASTAVEYAKHGARLVLGGRNEERLNETGEKCQQEGLSKGKILLVKGDLSVEDECNTLVDQAVEKFGQIDILINNAGSIGFGSIEQNSVSELDFMLNIHVRAVFIISKRAIPHLVKTRGAIVNISSVLGIRPLSMLAIYGVAKAAMIHLSATMAQDLGPKGVNVNCLTPGVIKTNIFDGTPISETPEKLAQFFEQAANWYPLRRIGDPAEIAKTILFLTSESASFITGVTLPIDGGFHGTTSAH